MTKSKKIAVVCKYALNLNRIGGMDRFYVAYDLKAKQLGYEIDWYFENYKHFDFFSGLTIFSANNQNVEHFFLEKIRTDKLEYAILITHFVALCTSFFKSAKTLGIQKTIAVDHNPRPLGGFPIFKRIKNKIKGMLYSGYIDHFIGVSEYTRKCILKDYGSFLDSKTRVIYNGIDTSVFIKRTSRNKNKFIVTSHLRESKGIQDLIKAVSILENEIKNQMQIDIYGEGPYENELITMVNNYDLVDSIQFKGSSSQISELLANYSYLLQPTYMECFSLSILESLSANVPVITTTVGGNLEIIENDKNGFVFEPKDFLALAKILKNIVLENKSIHNEVFGPIEKDYNLEKMVHNHIQLL